MKTIDFCLNYLDEQFQEQYDVRFVPSVVVGGGHTLRVTVSNLPSWLTLREYSSTGITYEAAMNTVLQQIYVAITDSKPKK